MRPAKFFLALLFGAAVLITFLKLLFIGIVFATIFGLFYFVFRAGQMTSGKSRHFPMAQAYGPQPLDRQEYGAPFNRGYAVPQTPHRAPGRHIEVL